MRFLFPAIIALLLLTFVTGGGSMDRGMGDVAAQLLALPVLAGSLWHLRSRLRQFWLPLTVLALVVAVVAVQLLPLPAWLWETGSARSALLADLSVAGVEPWRSWSMAPWATGRGLLSILPALALSIGALTLEAAQRQRMIVLVIALVLASMMLGYVQLGLPQDSPLNLFPEWRPALNGFFSNPNHQATAMGVALVLLLALLLQGSEQTALPPWSKFVMGLAGAFLLVSLPLVGSRAMLPLALLALMAVPLLDGSVVRLLRASSWPRPLVWLGLAAALSMALFLVWGVSEWVRFDAQHETRHISAWATVEMGRQLSPWGAGLGSFVAWFDQHAPAAMIGWEYVNHAHNEYAQWWLESGVPGMVALAAVLGLLLWAFPRAGSARRADAVAVGSWIAVVLVLCHSTVDYPLRTPSMAAVTALLAGFAVAAAARRQKESVSLAPQRRSSARDPAAPRLRPQ